MKKMYPTTFLAFFAFLFLSINVFSQGGTCSVIEPFCAGDQSLIFANCNNTDPSCNATAEPGPDYGCLGTQPYPAWFYLQVDQSGNLNFQIVQNTSFDINGNPTGTGLDVDFICWGPFNQGDNLCDYTQLQSFNEIACSFSPAPVENFTIPGAVSGQIYVLVITNYNQSAGFIKLEQTNAGQPGAGSTDCSILTTQTGCEGETFTLDASELDATNYLWEYDDGTGFVTIFNGDFPVINVTGAGDYRVTITFASGTPQIREFQVVILPTPVIASPPNNLVQCDDGINTGVFDLTVNDAVVLGAQDPAEFNVTYHNTPDDAFAGSNPINPANAYPIATPPLETIYLRIADQTGTCFETDSFTIEFSSATAGPMTDIIACDDGSGTTSLDLVALKDAEALGAQSPDAFTVTYHASQAEADAGINAHPNPYTATAPQETIFVRVENNDTPTCYGTDSFVVDIFETPTANQPSPIVLCDEAPNDGLAEFDLTIRDNQITGGNPNAVVFYYITLGAAQAGLDPIPTPTAWTNTVPNFQTIYARVENVNNPDCFSITSLVLQVDDAPSITDPISDYFICDNDQDGFEVFDLTSKDSEILNILVNVTLTYHTSQADALGGTNAIANPTNYVSGGELIWVRAENSAGCVTVGSFGLILGDIPMFVEVDEFEQCDNDSDGLEDFDLNSQNATIVGGNLNLSVSYHPTLGDAQGDSNPLGIPYTSAGGEFIWVRVEDNMTGCYGTFEMELIVLMAPEIFEPDPLTYCDDDNDGFGEFTLTDADEDVVNGNPSGNLVVSYHETLADAQNGVNALSSPYTNVDPFTQTLYVRLLDLATGCYSTTTLLLIVQDSPLINDPAALVLCDDDGDGVEIFDLTQVEPEVLGSLDPANYTISYYEDPALTIAIVNTTAYPNISNPQTIHIVVEDIANGCQGLTTVELIVNLPPSLVAPTPLELCDVNNPGDEMEAFNLESKTFEITGGDPTIVITYHETQGDADAGINALNSPYVNTVPQPQTIYIRAVGGGTGCVVSQGFTLDLVVNPLPSPVTPTPLEVCDVNNDGFAMFDLTSKDAEIIAGEPGVILSYHETLSDANLGIFPLSSPYQNIVAGMQTVYARAEYGVSNPPPNNTGCFRVVELDLIVLPTPVVPLNLDPLILCDVDGNGSEVFDLTQRAADIYGTQDPSLYSLTYHESLAAAQAGTPFIGSPQSYTNLSNPQTIYVRLEDNSSGCFKIGQFELQTPSGPAVTQPTPLSVCDDVGEPWDGISVFDLTVKNDEITGGALGVGVRYYETLADAQNDENVIDPDTAYTNLTNPQTLYVRVSDGNTGCVNTTTTLTLRVSANPDPEAPDALSLCDVNDPGDGVEVFDLTVVEAQILDGETWDVSYHESYDDAFAGVNAIVDPTLYSNLSNPQTIYIRVTNNTIPEACFEIVTLELIVNPLPDASVVISDYIICEVPSNGMALFDLSSKIPEILGGQDPSVFVVSFYESQVEAQGMLNPIQNTTAYPNSTNPQTIYVGILNSQTGCYVATQSFDLEEREGAVANTPAAPYEICDNLGDNDGIGEFTLDGSTVESQALIDEILAGQDPSVYLLSFYESLSNAQTATDPLAGTYVNVINPQVIYARVDNSDTECFEITQVILKVEQLPELTLEESYRLCVDANGNPIPEEEGALSPPVIDTGLDASLYSFEWYFNGEIILGQSDPFITALEGGTYSVIVTELDSGCSTEGVTTVVLSSPPLEYEVLVSEAFSSSHTITVNVTQGLGEWVYQLDDGVFQVENVFDGVLPGTHLVTIKDANGCGSVTVEVGIVDYPRFVTPNQDGYHDTWNIIGIADSDPTAKIYIFDRFGKLLKQISPLGEGWDGTYNGNPLPSSDYWFLVEYKEDDTTKEFRGHFTLKR
ncbi:T9SS type B sorting domain-containing protein [Constantimarinum furrinae]|uniref:T9SS type B sorting domain-containing protein n=1 Tax=Constantimarinum furrinae TaxID=2562285 RepID=A0A7G8PUV1_9FLAO|nr:T9SS type B sorting domain-containing protein [Constantimarinum furrinae]QNJ98117.1 hypothetical protein ALE3EI_1559 [Constantimarinum furrinae]